MHEDWIDLFALFRENGVRYLVIGGYAVAFYGFERYTKDLDLWVARDEENAKAIAASLKAFGFPSKALKPAIFLDPRKVVVLGFEPFRIDIITQLEALEFETAWPKRKTRKNRKIPINYVSLDHLRILKAAAGRFVDQRDLEALAFCKSPIGERKERAAKGAPKTRSARESTKLTNGGRDAKKKHAAKSTKKLTKKKS